MDGQYCGMREKRFVLPGLHWCVRLWVRALTCGALSWFEARTSQDPRIFWREMGPRCGWHGCQGKLRLSQEKAGPQNWGPSLHQPAAWKPTSPGGSNRAGRGQEGRPMVHFISRFWWCKVLGWDTWMSPSDSKKLNFVLLCFVFMEEKIFRNHIFIPHFPCKRFLVVDFDPIFTYI